MSRTPLRIAQGMGLVAAAAVIVISYRFHPILGLVLLAATALGLACYLLVDDLASGTTALIGFLRHPVGWFGLAVLGAWILTAPAVLFFDPVAFAASQTGHISRDPREFYLIVSDDVAYAGASRTWDRTVSNLLTPHNTHIVPAWRLLTYALIRCAGNLEGLPRVLAFAAYGILVAVVLMAGRFVIRETGSIALGMVASVLTGTTSLMLTSGIWYSGSQPLWAAVGMLSSLSYAQSYRRTGRWIDLAFAAIAGSVAGGMWSAGHLAGPVTAVYLWFDGRRRCRLASAVPLLATAATVVLFLSMASKPIDSRVSFHGRTVGEAASPVQGAVLTSQAIPEHLVFANLGLNTETTPIQGIVMSVGLLVFWMSRRLRWTTADDRSWPSFAFNPLESAGAAVVLGCYLLEWTFRGYLQLESFRTISPYVVVPWYDVIPQIGVALFVAGWWSGPHRPAMPDQSTRKPTRWAAVSIAMLALGLILLNRPRVDRLIQGTVPAPIAWEEERFKLPRLLTMRADNIRSQRVKWQRRYLHRLDQAEKVAQRMGIGQQGIREAFGFLFIPCSTSRILSSQHEHYDVAGLLDLPPLGRINDPATVRAALETLLDPGPEPRPDWLPTDQVWPPE